MPRRAVGVWSGSSDFLLVPILCSIILPYYLPLLPTPTASFLPPAKLQITIISGNLDYKPKVEASLSKAIYIFLLSVLSGPP